MNEIEVVDLLPAQVRHAAVLRQRLLGWSSLAAVVLVLGCFYGTGLWREVRAIDREVQRLTSSTASVGSLIAELDQIRVRSKQLDEAKAHLESLRPTDCLLQSIGSVATAISQTRDAHPAQLASLRIDLLKAIDQVPQPSTTVVPQNRSSLPTNPAVELTLIGATEGDLQGALDQLREDPRFRDIRIRRSVVDPVSGKRQVEVEGSILVQRRGPR